MKEPDVKTMILANPKLIGYLDILTVNPVHLSWMQTVSFSASATPLESSSSNLLYKIGGEMETVEFDW